MDRKYISTLMGEIAVYFKNGDPSLTPVIFLHGVYFDHHLWDIQIAAIQERTVIALDMPYHGASVNDIHSNWDLEDVAQMLISILEELKLDQVIAIGHSWGSMTILRAVHQKPELFEQVILFNTPFETATFKTKLLFRLQHLLVPFRKFYHKAAAKALFAKDSLIQQPDLSEKLSKSMSGMSSRQIKLIDQKVILEAKDSSELFAKIKVPMKIIKGIADYVPAPKNIDAILIEGGHVSPLENPEKTIEIIRSWHSMVIN